MWHRSAHPPHHEDRHGRHLGRHKPDRHGPADDHKHHGGGRTLGRLFAHGDLRLVILQLIAEKPRHGYEIIKSIEERVGGSYSPSPGVIYPTLTLLEELGYVTMTASAEGARKLHEITAQGRSFLDANRPALDALLARMDEAARAESGEAPRRIHAAMDRLKLAVRGRLMRGPLTEAETDAVAAALEEAASAVEKT